MSEVALKNPAIFPLAEDPEAAATEPSPEFVRGLQELEPLARAEMLVRMGRWHPALRELQEIVAGNPDAEKRARCYVIAGGIRERLEHMEAARACYEEALTSNPQSQDVAYSAFNNLAYCLNRAGRPGDAEAACRRAVEIFPGRINAHKNLGIALEMQGRFEEAAASLLAAVRIDPHHPVAMRRLRVLVGAHPSIRRDRPEMAREVEELLAKSRKDWSTSKPIAGEDLEPLIRTRLKSIEVDEPILDGELQVFGLVWPLGDGPGYLTLDDALAGKTLEVREISEAGSVPRIRVVNHAKSDRVFLMAGEQLIGAKQNRVLNASILLDARADLPLPVSCVEQGRWSYRGPRFESRGSSSHYALRHMIAKHAHGSYRSGGTPESDQGEVWQEVNQKLFEHGTDSRSRALSDVYEKLKPRLDQAAERLQPRDHWCGAAFCFAGKIVGVDLFDRPATLQKQWAKLTRAYALDVLERKAAPQLSRNHVEDWIRSSADALIDQFPSTGLGVDCRLESNRHVGSVLVVDGRPVHLEMFYEEEM